MFYPTDCVFDYKDNDYGNEVTSGERGNWLAPQNGYQSYKKLQNLMSYLIFTSAINTYVR